MPPQEVNSSCNSSSQTTKGPQAVPPEASPFRGGTKPRKDGRPGRRERIQGELRLADLQARLDLSDAEMKRNAPACIVAVLSLATEHLGQLRRVVRNEENPTNLWGNRGMEAEEPPEKRARKGRKGMGKRAGGPAPESSEVLRRRIRGNPRRLLPSPPTPGMRAADTDAGPDGRGCSIELCSRGQKAPGAMDSPPSPGAWPRVAAHPRSLPTPHPHATERGFRLRTHGREGRLCA